MHVATKLRALLRESGLAAADLIWPPRCLLCHHLFEGGDAVTRSSFCEQCSSLLAYPQDRLCPRCAMPRPEFARNDGCGFCQNRRSRLATVTAIGLYRGAMREAVVAAKKASHEYLARALASGLTERLRRRNDLPPFDFLTYVPTHWIRATQRGGSGTASAAREISRRLDIPFRSLLHQQRRTKKQGMLSASERRRNVHGAFRLREGYALRGQVGLLIDDVYTTGATVEEVARMLRCGGVAELHVGVFARSTGQMFG